MRKLIKEEIDEVEVETEPVDEIADIAADMDGEETEGEEIENVVCINRDALEALIGHAVVECEEGETADLMAKVDEMCAECGEDEVLTVDMVLDALAEEEAEEGEEIVDGDIPSIASEEEIDIED